jgi:hypothetical protein
MKLEKQTNYVTNISKKEMDKYYALLDKRIENSDRNTVYIKYLTLGNITVKIENHVPELIFPIEKQLPYCLSDQSDHYDKIFYIWKEDIRLIVADFAQDADAVFLSSKNTQKPFLEIFLKSNMLIARNQDTQTHYLCANDFSLDTIRKMGHLFVRQINELAKTPDQAMVHSAAVGVNGAGALMCARGGGGKSTLAVSALLNGFQYVADDYLILNKTDRLYTYPIYSTINLSQRMYKQMNTLQSEYLYDNYYKPKYTLSIVAHHDRFVKKLPIEMVIFPKISEVEKPSIEPMDKGKAIVQMIHSTISQMGDETDPGFVKRLISILSDLDFYQINLSPNLDANVMLLKQFIIEKRQKPR